MVLLTTNFILSTAPSIFDNKRQDPTGLTALLRSTDLVGVVHTLYCILLHSFLPESASQSQEPYGPGVIQVALQGIRFLNSFAMLDLSAFQVFVINPEYFLAFTTKSKSLNHLPDFSFHCFTCDVSCFLLFFFFSITYFIHWHSQYMVCRKNICALTLTN